MMMNESFRASRLLVLVPLVLALLLLLRAFYTIDTGHVGVEKTLGQVDLEEQTPGIHFRLPLITQRWELSAKEIPLDLDDLTPKAADNLSLKDLDVTVYYRVASDRIADLRVKYASAEAEGEGALLPAYGVVYRDARGVIYDSISAVDSLVLHRQREKLQAAIETELQQRLDAKDPGAFTVSRVVIRALNTDPSIEESIRTAVQNQKRLEAKKIEVDIAAKDAEIEIARARGIAEANRIINASLTAEYLRHEINKALHEFAEHDNSVVVIPANMQGFELILDGKSMQRPRASTQ
jgi:regulator of protease activity HflC (stomatin/prohibitin superfamily)